MVFDELLSYFIQPHFKVKKNKCFRMISSFMRERETEIFVLLYHSKHTFNHLDFKTVLIDFFLLSTFLGFETV